MAGEIEGEEPDHALLCPPDEKAQREAANGLEQVEYISQLVDLGVVELRESHLLQLHRLAVAEIYPCAGNFRSMPVKITHSPHQPPEQYFVRQLSVDALEWINSQRATRSALERAAYALWRFNWIHPFAGGNGRTSRALAYLIICADDQAMMPGKPTMPALIYDRRHEYINALRRADASALGDGDPDFSAMTEFLRDVLMQQMAAAINRLSSPGVDR